MKDKAEAALRAGSPLTDAEFTMSAEEWAEAFAEDPSCIYTYLRAAEARGRAEGRRLALIEVYEDLAVRVGDANEALASGNAPQAPTDSLLQVTPEDPTQETNQQRAGETPAPPSEKE